MKKLLLLCLFLFACGNSSNGRYVSVSEFGEKWPFTVSDGYVYSLNSGFIKIFEHNGNKYALTSFAKSYGEKHNKRYKNFELIWKDNPRVPGTKISIGSMIKLAEQNSLK